MKRKRAIRRLCFAVAAVAVLLVAFTPAFGQCALCRTAITGSPSAARMAQKLNIAIIVLLIPPVTIFCGIFYAAVKARKSREEDEDTL